MGYTQRGGAGGGLGSGRGPWRGGSGQPGTPGGGNLAPGGRRRGWRHPLVGPGGRRDGRQPPAAGPGRTRRAQRPQRRRVRAGRETHGLGLERRHVANVAPKRAERRGGRRPGSEPGQKAAESPGGRVAARHTRRGGGGPFPGNGVRGGRGGPRRGRRPVISSGEKATHSPPYTPGVRRGFGAAGAGFRGRVFAVGGVSSYMAKRPGRGPFFFVG